jgi:LuxR family maltose regulon positive regulatory protein
MLSKPDKESDLPLLKTKISIPQLPAEYVARPRLTARIQRGVLGPLTLLAAPAGFGKTNLLIEWTEKTDLPVAWLTIDSEDNDLGRFFQYLIGALQTVEPGFGEEALDYIQSTKSGGVEVGLSLLINELSTLQKEVVLVLDEFQNLDDSAILQGIDFFLKHIPPNLHLVLASRSMPTLDLAFLQAKGRVVELDADDLRFSREEVALFIQQAMGQQLPSDTIQALEERTDGWITGLQMAAIYLRHHANPVMLLANLQGEVHYLVDFLAEEVLDRQTEEIRQFLLRSSVLETLTGPLCEAVVNPKAQPGYGTVMLNRLEHANLFITALDEKHEWFRYYHLFADFLRHIQAEINPAEIPVLHKRAALWLEQDDNLDEAFRHALASGDLEWTAKLIERNTETMIKTGEIFSFTRWIGKLPHEMIHQRPRLALAYAWGLIAAYRLDLARYWIEDVQETLDQLEEQVGPTVHIDEPETVRGVESTGLWNIRGGLAICKSTLALLSGDAEQAAEFSRQAASYLGYENPFIHSLLALDESLYFVLSGDTRKAIGSLLDTIRIARQANNLLVMMIATCQLAEMQALQGQLSQACATLQKAQYLAVGPTGERLELAGLADIGFGEILIERNSLEEASEYLKRGITTTGSLWWLSNLDGMVSLARLHQAEGDIDGAQGIIAEAARMALSTESSQWDDAAVSAVAIRLAIQRDDLATAEQWWQKGHFPDLTGTISLENYPYHILEYLMLTQARFILVKGVDTGNALDLQRSLNLLGSLLLEAERFQRVTSQIEILVLQAMAHFALGDGQAKKALLHALALGEPEGYRRIYLDEGRRLSELLLQCRSAQPESGSYLPSLAFIDSLLEAIQRTNGTQLIAQRSVEQRADLATTRIEEGLPTSLSARELEVLALIAEGKSNQEISAQLYLAINTVKRHAYNIYAKLEVKNRTQAVSRARQLGLIP